MENLLLNFGRSVNIELALWHYKQELFVVGCWRWQPNNFKHSIETTVYLALEANLRLVVNDREMRVADPCID